MASGIVVLGDLATLDVTGSMSGSLTVEGDLRRMNVKSDALTVGQDIDVVLLDINLPGRDGLQLARELSEGAAPAGSGRWPRSPRST